MKMGEVMSSTKIAISIDSQYLARLEHFVKSKVFKNRSQAIEHAVIGELERLEHSRLAKECEKLDLCSEREMAEEGFAEDSKTWPKY